MINIKSFMENPACLITSLCTLVVSITLVLVLSGCSTKATNLYFGEGQDLVDFGTKPDDPPGSGDPPSYLPPPGGVPGGLLNGHFDLDTSHLVYPFGSGDTDKHVHEYDKEYETSGADFFALQNERLSNINGNFQGNRLINDEERFFLIVGNSALSTGGYLEINGVQINVVTYDAITRVALNQGGTPQVYTLGSPIEEGDLRLTSFKINFGVNVIEEGGLIPTVTGCVVHNDIGLLNEYRNGALTLQAIKLSSYIIDPVTGLASFDNGSGNGGLLWETTIFWHKDGNCYN